MHLIKRVNEFREMGIVLTIIAILLGILSRDLVTFGRLFAAFVVVLYLPGYALGCLLFKEWGRLEKAIVAPFLGMGPAPIIAYTLSMFGIKAVSPVFSFLLSVIAVFVILGFCKREK